MKLNIKHKIGLVQANYRIHVANVTSLAIKFSRLKFNGEYLENSLWYHLLRYSAGNIKELREKLFEAVDVINNDKGDIIKTCTLRLEKDSQKSLLQKEICVTALDICL